VTPFVRGLAGELSKLAMGGVAQVDSDLAQPQKTEDAASQDRAMGRKAPNFFQTNPGFAGKIRPGKLGPQSGGPLLADPSRWPTNRLTS
jgi:hypothetical protein